MNTLIESKKIQKADEIRLIQQEAWRKEREYLAIIDQLRDELSREKEICRRLRMGSHYEPFKTEAEDLLLEHGQIVNTRMTQTRF